MGQSPSSSSYNEISEGLPFYQGNADFGELYPIVRYYCSKPTKIAFPNDILLSVRAPIGALNIANEKCCIGRGLAALTPGENLEMKYLYYILKDNHAELNAKGTGSTFKAINKSTLCDFKIPLPPIEIQQKIAKILDAAGDLLKLRKQQLAELDQLIQSVFYEMFGDPVTNEKGWDSIELNKLAEIVSGITKGRKIKEQELFTVPYMRVANVKDGHIDLTEIKTIEATQTEIERYSLKDKDVLMTEGGDPDKLGRGAIWRADIKDCIHQNHIFRVRVEQEKIDSQYFSEYLKLPNAKQYFLRCAKQTTGIASINMRQLKLLPVLLPPIKMQIKFAAIVEKIEAEKALVQQSIDETQTLFDSLMSQYFE
jgi:type I restriction enzyme S subunit